MARGVGLISAKAAFEIATTGRATPEAALKDASKNMKK
jgi:hypothetical protein